MTTNDAPDAAELEEIFVSIDPTRVRMAQDYLTDAGIESYLFDETTSRMLGNIVAVPVRLMVHRDEAADARERLNDLGFTQK